MKKNILLILAMLFTVTTSWAQVNVDDDEIDEEDEITVKRETKRSSSFLRQ